MPSSDPTFAAVGRWVVRHLGTADHERRVTDIAATLFDLSEGVHGLDDADRRLVQLAGLVHDIGRSRGEENHAAVGAAMVLSSPASLPLSDSERRQLAYLTLYHRGDVPNAGDDDVLHREDDAPRMLKVLALLRAADALDSRSLESPRLVFAWVAGRPRVAGARAAAASRPRLCVTCYLQADSAKARRVYQRRKKFRLLEQVLGCQVEVEIVLAQALRMVA
jgi:exopolyphosphatase/pppGpp-phosphohydrolase